MKIQPLPDPREERELAQQLNQALRPLDETPPPSLAPDQIAAWLEEETAGMKKGRHMRPMGAAAGGLRRSAPAFAAPFPGLSSHQKRVGFLSRRKRTPPRRFILYARNIRRRRHKRLRTDG